MLFVSLMAAYALQLRDHADLGPYSHERAERFARCVMIDDDEFRMLDANGLDDRLLAGHFEVPVEHVATKRDDEIVGVRRDRQRASQLAGASELEELAVSWTCLAAIGQADSTATA